MHRAFGVIVLAAVVGAALGCAPAALAQDQSSPDRFDTQTDDYRPRPLDPPRIVPAEAYAKGVEALKAKHYRQAIRTLAKLTDVEPNKAAGWRVLGAAYAGEQRWGASRRAYKRAIYLAPDDVISHAGLGVALVALNDPKAQKQADWLKAKAQACNATCPEAPILEVLETRGPFAAPSSMD